ncbi:MULTISPECIES: hypothetical protein [unclassified Streptomyces]|uniref:hypothetical protein n=1 Tax=unclassified Streptomyces TaxID=2593676 RepID=UPI0033316EF3
MRRLVRRRIAVAWIALVLAGGAYTLCLDDPTSTTPEPKRWERGPSPSDGPVACPTESGGGVAATARGCTYWQRG